MTDPAISSEELEALLAALQDDNGSIVYEAEQALRDYSMPLAREVLAARQQAEADRAEIGRLRDVLDEADTF